MSDIDNGTKSNYTFNHKPQRMFKNYKLHTRITNTDIAGGYLT